MAIKDPLGILTKANSAKTTDDPLGILKKKEESNGGNGVEMSGINSGTQNQQSESNGQNGFSILDPSKQVTINVAGRTVPITEVPIPFTGEKSDYAKGLQERINSKSFTPEDIESVAKSMKVIPLSASAFMDNKPQTAIAVQLSDVKQKYGKSLEAIIQKANTDLGRNDNFENILSTPESVSAYINQLDSLYKQKAEKEFNSINDTPENRRAIEQGHKPVPFLINWALGLDTENQGETFIDKNLPKGAAIYNKIQKDNLTVANKFKGILGSEIVNRITDGDGTYDEKVETIAKLLSPVEYENSRRAIKESLKPVNYLIDFATGGDTKAKIDALKTTKGHVELGINNRLEEMIMYNNALSGSIIEEMNDKISKGLTDEKEIQKYKDRVDEIQSQNVSLQRDYKPTEKILEEYPVLFKQSVIDKLNEYNAITSGNVEGQDKLNISRDEFLKNNGFDPNDQRVKDAINSGDGKDYSHFGNPAKEVLDVFKNAGKSTLDIVSSTTGIPFRQELDVLSEKKLAELFPNKVGENDTYQLKGLPSLLQNISNTTGQVIGQGLLQSGTMGVGRIAGLSRLAASNTAFWSSGALTSYDQAYKDSYDFIDTDTGRVAYAGLIALSNAASVKIFQESKIFNIPGVRDAAAQIATKIGSGKLTDKLVNESLSTVKNSFVDFAKKYGKNIGQETIEEVSTDLFESGTRFLFGDPNIDMDKAIESAKNTAIQTALGTSVIAGFGANADMKTEKNMSAKSTIYNAALYHDEALDAINIGYANKLYNEQERDSKIQILNTAKNANQVLEQTEKVSGKTLTRPQKELYVANLTAESLLHAQKTGTTESVLAEEIDNKISSLKNQRKGILAGEVQIDDYGNFITSQKVEDKSGAELNANLTTEDLKPTILVNGKEYSGNNHGEAMDKAIAAGEDIPNKNTPEGKLWRSENGLFKDKTGDLLTRDESGDKYGIRNSEELADNKNQDAISLLKQARDEKRLGIFQAMDDESALEMIAQQAQSITEDGKQYKGDNAAEVAKMAYNGAVNQFGESLVKAAIEKYPQTVGKDVAQKEELISYSELPQNVKDIVDKHGEDNDKTEFYKQLAASGYETDYDFTDFGTESEVSFKKISQPTESNVTPSEQPLNEVVNKETGTLKSENKNVDLQNKINNGEEITKQLPDTLSPTEKQGSIRGGETNAEATIITGTVHSANEAAKARGKGLPSEKIKIKEAGYLESNAKENGTWIEDNFGEPHTNGFEQDVYMNPDGNTVTKLHNNVTHDTWNDLFHRIAIHNSLFPDVAYTLKGFTKHNGELAAVFEQPLIKKGGEPIKYTEVVNELSKLGFEPSKSNEPKKDGSLPNVQKTDADSGIKFINEKTGVEISDLHGENVMRGTDGKLHFIDPIIELSEDRITGKTKVNEEPKTTDGFKQIKMPFEEYRDKVVDMAERMKDSSFDWRLNIPELSQKDRDKAVTDIRAGKESVVAKKLLDAIQSMYNNDEIRLNRGRGNNAETVSFGINQWFGEPLNDNELNAAENITDEQVRIIEEEGITLDNIDKFENLFNGFPYEQSDYEAIKNYLTTEGKGSADNKGTTEQGKSQTATDDNSTEVEKSPEQSKINQAFKKQADRIRKGKISNDISMVGVPFAKEIWNAAIEIVASSVELTGNFVEAIESGVKYIKSTEWYKGLSKEDKERAEDKFRSGEFVNEEESDAIKNSLSDRIQNVEHVYFGKSRYSAVDTFAEEGFGQLGRKPQGRTTTIGAMIQARLDFIEELNDETDGKAITMLMDHFGFNEHNNKSAKDIPLKGLSNEGSYAMVNTLFAYINRNPLSTLNITPVQSAAYNKYLSKLSNELGRKLGQELNTGKIRNILAYTETDHIMDSVLTEQQKTMVTSAEDIMNNIRAGEHNITDEDLIASEEALFDEYEFEKQAEQSRTLSEIIGLKKQQAISKSRSERMISRLEKEGKEVEQKIKNLINKIKCD